MTNPFTHAGKAVSDAWDGAGKTDFWSPGMGRTMAAPFIPVVAVAGFVSAFFVKPEPKK